MTLNAERCCECCVLLLLLSSVAQLRTVDISTALAQLLSVAIFAEIVWVGAVGAEKISWLKHKDFFTFHAWI